MSNKTINKKSNKLQKIVLTSIFSALIVVMTFMPYLGYIVYGMLSITTLHIIVIIGAILLGKRSGTVLGLVWGLSCLLYALMNGTADAVIFLNPLISVLPRIFVGFLSAFYYKTCMKLFRKKEKYKILAIVITAILGTLTNTTLVLTAITVFSTGFVALGATIKIIIQTALALNGVVELSMAVILVPVISIPIMKQLKK